MYEVYYEDNNTVTICLYKHDKKIGSINFAIAKDVIFIFEMDVKTQYRGYGYGKKLYKYFKQYMFDKQFIGTVELTTSKDSIDFWKKMGFLLVSKNNQVKFKYVMQSEVTYLTLLL